MESNQIKLPSWFEFRFGNWIAKQLTKFVESRTPDDIRLINIASIYEQSQCLYVAAKLKVADCLMDSPKNIESLAIELNVQAKPLDRVLSYLNKLGIFEKDSIGRYSLNKSSELLLSNNPQSMRAVVLLYGEDSYPVWSN